MKLRRLRVSQFKQFAEPFELSGLEDGLVIVAGANEAGKSTLSLAIRSAFFERHNTSTLDTLRPHGDSSARPEVELEFDLQGQPALLTKRFLRQAACDLRLGQQQLDGNAAEEYLAEQMGFSIRKRGASQDSDWGVPGLLWVQQGDLHRITQAVQAASNHLGDALGASVGALGSSDSDEVLTEVSQRLAELLTATGKPRAEYLKCLQEHEQLQAEVTSLQHEVEGFQQRVSQLDSLRQQWLGQQTQQPWLKLRAQIPTLQQEVQAAERYEAQRQQLSEREQLLKHELDYLDQALQRAQSEQQRYDALSAQLQQLKIGLDEDTEAQSTMREQLQQAELLLREARQQRQGVEAYSQWQQQQREREALLRRHGELQQSLKTVQQLSDQLQVLGQQTPTRILDDAALTAMQQASHQCAVLEAQLSTVSTRLHFDVEDPAAISLNGVSLMNAQATCTLSEATELAIAGVGRIRIEPGGQDLETLRLKRQQAQQQLSTLLQPYGVNDVGVAAQLHQEHLKQRNELAKLESMLAVYAPEGVVALREKSAALERSIQALAIEMPKEVVADLPLEQAQQQEQQALVALERLQQLWQDTQRRAIESQVKLTAAKDEWQQLHQRLHDATHVKQSQAEARRRVEVEQSITATQEALAQLAQQQSQVRSVASIQAEIDNVERRAAQAQRQFEDLRLELSRLETELQIMGAKGLDEQLRNKQLMLEHVERRVAHFQSRSETLSYLRDQLMAARTQLRERLQAPLLQRVQYYLRFLFPEARVVLSEEFVPTVLQRGSGHPVSLDELSFGAAEQIAIITRLAYADLLKEAGRPTLIVLDDVLAYSDSQRLDRMKAAIYDASNRHQVLLFTCNPQLWSDAGGQMINLEQHKLTSSLN